MKKNNLLKLLFTSIVVKQLVWIAFVPMWQFPDEQAHFGQVAYSVELGKRGLGNDLNNEIYLSEKILGTERDSQGNNQYTFHPEYNILYSDNNDGFFEKEIKNYPIEYRYQMVKIESTFYPPLYYFLSSLFYKLFYYQDLFSRVFIIRLSNLFYYLLTVYISYKLFLLVFRNNSAAFLGSLLVAFQPMLSFAMSGATSDNLFILLFTLVIYHSILILLNNIKARDLLVTIILIVSSIYTKPQGYILIIIYLFPYFYSILKKKKINIIYLILIILIFITPFLYRYYKYQLFIPEIGLINIKPDFKSTVLHLKWTLIHTYKEVLPWYWGVFRWLSLTLPRSVNRLVNRVLAILFLGLLVYIYKIIKNKQSGIKKIILLFTTYTVLSYFLILTVWDYLFTITHGFSFGMQGRYYLPIIVSLTALMLYGLLGLSEVSFLKKFKKLIALTLGLFIIIIHEIGLFTVLFSYYSIKVNRFFIQASQYKPWFFKSPILEVLMVFHMLTIGLLVYKYIKIYQYEKA